MKISKRQLRKVIREEYSHRLNEQYDSSIETGSGLIDFAKAYASLGHAVQEQVDQLVSAYFSGGGPDSEAFEEAVYEVNPNAVDLAWNRLSRPARMAGDEGEDIMHALDVAKEMFNRETIEESGMPSSITKHMPDAWRQVLGDCLGKETSEDH